MGTAILSLKDTMGESSNFPKTWTFEIQVLKLVVRLQIVNNFKVKWSIVLRWNEIREVIIICLIRDFEADFLWKVSLKILNSGIILNTFTHDTGVFDQTSWTHVSLASFLCDIGKQCKTRSDAAKCGDWSGFPLFAYRSVF